MNYLNPNDNKEHIMNLLVWLYQECLGAGGDGDALWYSRFYNIYDLLPLVKEANSLLKFPYKEIKLEGNWIHWGENQEWVMITNDEEAFKRQPDWVQAKIRY